MYLTDVRGEPNANTLLRTTTAIHRIVVSQYGHDDIIPASHYVILPTGRMEYRFDATVILQDPLELSLAVIQQDKSLPPSREQCESLRLLFSYLLLPRTITPQLTSSQQIYLAPLEKMASGIVHGKQTSWFRSLFEGNLHRLPPLLAEYQGQEILAKTPSEITVAFYFKNTGSRDWVNFGDQCMSLFVSWEEGSSSYTLQKQYGIAEGTSLFYHTNWIDQYCPGHLQEKRVKPGEKSTFICTLATKLSAGKYREDFGIATEHQWVDNIANGNKAHKAHCWIEITLP